MGVPTKAKLLGDSSTSWGECRSQFFSNFIIVFAPFHDAFWCALKRSEGDVGCCQHLCRLFNGGYGGDVTCFRSVISMIVRTWSGSSIVGVASLIGPIGRSCWQPFVRCCSHWMRHQPRCCRLLKRRR